MTKLFSSRVVSSVLLVGLAILCALWIHPVSALAVPVAFGIFGVPSLSDIGRQLAAWGFNDPSGGKLRPPIVAKTANYQVVSPFAAAGGDPSGTLFTTRGAGGAVTFTLPVITALLAGVEYEFTGVANQNIGVAAAAGTVITFNNVAATSVTASTAGGKIGAHFKAICDGISWHVIGDAVGVTYTVA